MDEPWEKPSTYPKDAGAMKIAWVGDIPLRETPKALNLMTVQPEADQRSAETGADQEVRQPN